MVSNIVYFGPYLGRWSNLTIISFRFGLVQQPTRLCNPFFPFKRRMVIKSRYPSPGPGVMESWGKNVMLDAVGNPSRLILSIIVTLYAAACSSRLWWACQWQAQCLLRGVWRDASQLRYDPHRSTHDDWKVQKHETQKTHHFKNKS